MYLKSIEVQGFKSFAHKLVLEFHNGITGIVGPNGSGKSNVADAVRWVLGEQRIKQLRGGSMQDVIFSGTESRKPLSYAYVAITLDNSDHQLAIDYEEVTIARKLYRSGESEYLINGSTCRLKDVNELFYDTGIGKEGYSIIGQGQIDKILSGKPEDRRELFDEAAGIVKFKRRKNLSLKKLETERANLLRVNDVLAELEKQKAPLQRQAEKAKEYLKKKEELKSYDINMFLLEMERLAGQIEETAGNLKIVRDEKQTETQRYEDTKADYEVIEEEMDTLDGTIEHYRSKLNETNLLKAQLENQIALLQEQIRSAHTSDEHYAQRTAAIEAEIAERNRQLSLIEQERKETKQKLEMIRKEEEEANELLFDIQTRIGQLSGFIDENKNAIIELLNNRAQTRAKIQRYDTMLEQILFRKKELNEQLENSHARVAHACDSRKQNEQELKEISDRILHLTEENEAAKQEIEKLSAALDVTTEKLRTVTDTYHRGHSRLESLKNLAERYDGYGSSIRRVMGQKKTKKGLIGVVADIIQVDKKYETAIETALGGNIQNIVTDNEETAKEMIAYLKAQKLGRATFLPLTSVTVRDGFRIKDALNENGVIQTADKLVSVDDKYRNIADSLLGRTLVVDHIDNGIRIARKFRQSLRIVTLEGDLLNPGGSMTGGAFKNSSNLLGRKREIEELSERVKALSDEMEQARSEAEDLRDKRAGFYHLIDENQKSLQEFFVIQNTAKMNLNLANDQIDNENSLADRIRTELKEIHEQTEKIRENQESITLELDTSENLESDLTMRVTADSEELDSLREQEDTGQKEAQEILLSLAGLEQSLFFTDENKTRIREEIQKFRQEQEELNLNKSGASLEIQRKEEQILDIQAAIDDSKELFEEIETEISRSVEERENLNKKHKAFLNKREEITRHLADLDREIFRLENRLNNCEEARDKQINYMWEEYELTHRRALELRSDKLTDLSSMKKRIHALKNEIKALGPVNVNAIEDYKTLAERYDFLKGQHDDLVEAEAALVKIIDELDKSMRKQFTEQFNRIAKEYDVVFKELFGGGKGTLELMEDEDVLDAGIRIIAQPPGKKLQNMMQLSGGEKALTAICLLFAIQNLKPSPFCLLDEIEAALDDTNVIRFANYLHKLTKNTQFIVITHRRGTMEKADRLYGITMQEKGVSALVSVNLIDEELDD